MRYTIQQIAGFIGVAAEADIAITITHCLTDSRKLTAPEASLFFALQTASGDGHLFIDDLYQRGVKAFVVHSTFISEGYDHAVFLKITDVLAALQLLAALHRQRFDIPVIGITGSNGKTVVKEWLFELLQPEHHVVRSPKSYNSQIGVPLSVLEMSATDTLALFEAGISATGEMDKLQTIIQPTVGVLTNIGEAHSAGFSSTEEKLSEKLKLFANAEVLIGAYELIKEVAGPKQRFSWGTNAEATVQLLSVQKTPAATVIRYRFRGAEGSLDIPFTDEASAENAVTCLCVGLYIGLEERLIRRRLYRLQAVDMRLQLKHSNNGCMVINDSYSADVTSLKIALQFLEQQSAGLRRTVILSSFEGSGNEVQLYSEIAHLLLLYQIEKAILIGTALATLVAPAVVSKMDVETYAATPDFLSQVKLSSFFNEIILIKGARRAGLEAIARLFEKKHHGTVLQINLNALAHNIKAYRRLLKLPTKIMAMVKAFSYGSGSAEIAGVLQFHKVDYLGVAYADEGVELVGSGIYIPVMVMNAEASSFEAITANNLQPVIYSFDLLRGFEAHLKRQGLTSWPVHLEIETGMNRLGFGLDEVPALAEHVAASSLLVVQSVFSHLAAADDAAQDDFTYAQAQRFETAIRILQQHLSYPFLRHIAASAAIVRHPQLHLDMVRLGIGMYGIEQDKHKELTLETVATLRSTIAQIRHIKKGESVSYNRRGRVEQDAVIATVRIGYGDGYSRRFSNGVGRMWVKGSLAPVIGSVCMDMTMIDVTGIADVRAGDDVVIFGPQLPVQQVAGWAGTIPYEIMTGISQRVKRVYFHE